MKIYLINNFYEWQKIEVPFETLLEIQLFLGFIEGFIINNNQIPKSTQEKIKGKIKAIDEKLDNIIL